MPHTAFSQTPATKKKTDISITLGLTAALLFFAASGLISYWNTRVLSRNTAQVTRTHEVILTLNSLLSIMKDAETGQRGYVLTGKENYLEPYNNAIDRIEPTLNDLEQHLQDNPESIKKLPTIKEYVHKKLAELTETIELRRAQGFDAALAVVVTDRGKNEMSVLRTELKELQEEQQAIRMQRMNEMQRAYWVAIISGILTCVLGLLLTTAIGWLLRRAALVRERQQWLQAGQVGISTSMLGEQRVEQLGNSLLTYLAEYSRAHAGALYVNDGTRYRRVATYGIPADAAIPTAFNAGDGLLGQAVKDKRSFTVSDVPEGYLTIGSALGRTVPRHLVIMPTRADGDVNAVFELGFVQPPTDDITTLLEELAESIGVAVKSANYREKLQNLLEETQRQSEELQAQSEELRVNNEELEEQSRALKESQTRLEQQHAEMEQINAQLEEQTQLLEGQRDDLSRAKASVQLKAQELEQASQYKSDFLANMSHELRTPLNSSLILAKLLSDNPTGNLSDEQIKFAQTIQSSGNDLLALINDILDLSKIEAGHMEIRAENMPLSSMIKNLARMFDPIANQKGLTFETRINPGVPEVMQTDRLRLEQVIKNLLSNALKFTEKGKVTLVISKMPQNKIAIAVADTGIGIRPRPTTGNFRCVPSGGWDDKP